MSSRKIRQSDLPEGTLPHGAVAIVVASMINTAAKEMKSLRQALSDNLKTRASFHTLRFRVCTIDLSDPNAVATTQHHSHGSTSMVEQFSPPYDTVILMSLETFKAYGVDSSNTLHRNATIESVLKSLETKGATFTPYRWPKPGRAKQLVEWPTS